MNLISDKYVVFADYADGSGRPVAIGIFDDANTAAIFVDAVEKARPSMNIYTSDPTPHFKSE